MPDGGSGKPKAVRIFNILTVAAVFIAAELLYFGRLHRAEEKRYSFEEPAPVPGNRVVRGEIQKGQTFNESLEAAGIPAEAATEIADFLQAGGQFDFRSLRPGQQYAARLDMENHVERFTFKAGLLTSHILERGADGRLSGRVETLPTEKNKVVINGTITDSLYNAVVGRGELPKLAGNLVRVFEYDIDFAQEVRKGDTFRIFLERVTLKGEVVDYGTIFAAEYNGRETGVVRGYWFPNEKKDVEGYYNESGVRLKKFFLRAPLDVLRVTSRFGSRFHPVLKRMHRHAGVDYGAPQGTAVWAVADGVVARAGRAGAYGNLVEIRHVGGLMSRYGHLSRIHVRSGQKVSQRQLIGRVGSTGRSTGPHLHYELLRNGTHINPAKVKAGGETRMAQSMIPQLRNIIAEIISDWEKAPSIEAAKKEVAPGAPDDDTEVSEPMQAP